MYAAEKQAIRTALGTCKLCAFATSYIHIYMNTTVIKHTKNSIKPCILPFIFRAIILHIQMLVQIYQIVQ
jgi:hypothetical protein